MHEARRSVPELRRNEAARARVWLRCGPRESAFAAATGVTCITPPAQRAPQHSRLAPGRPGPFTE
jgi:hypothetical protein